jgi:hypothetical protein
MALFSKHTLAILLRLLAGAIMIQSLFFKFSGADESVYIFSTLEMEPWGRIGTGVVELISSVLLIVPRTIWIGALTGMGTMVGAIFFHLTLLGIEIRNDGGLLFVYAIVTFISCAIILLFEKKEAQKTIGMLLSK